MRILIVAPFPWHAPGLARGLEQLGHETVVYSCVPSAFSTPTRRIRLRAVLRVSFRLGLFERLVRIVVGRVAIRALRAGNWDALIAWSGFGTALLSKGVVPTILVRGSHHIRTQREILSRLPKGTRTPTPAIVRMEEREYAQATLVTVPTQLIAADPGWGTTRLVVAPYGFDEPMAAGNSVATARAGRLRGVFVGEIGYQKGADLLRRLDDIRAVERVDLVGSGSPRKLRLPRKAILHGRLSNEAVKELMCRSQFLVLLSRQEGQARVGLEAAAVGLPLLVTEQTGLGGLCDAGAGVLVPAEPTVGELRDAINRIAGEWQAMSDAARAYAQSWKWVDHAKLLVDSLSTRTPDDKRAVES